MDNPQLQQGIQAAKAGNNALARSLLIQVVQRDPNNEMAWIWLAQAMDDPARKVDCLQQALRINPGNDAVRNGLQKLLQSTSLQAPPPEPEPEPEPEEPVWDFDQAWDAEVEPEASASWDVGAETASPFQFEPEPEPEAGPVWDIEPAWSDEAESASEPEPWQPESEEGSEPLWDLEQTWGAESEAEPASDFGLEADAAPGWDFAHEAAHEAAHGAAHEAAHEAAQEELFEPQMDLDWASELGLQFEPESPADLPVGGDVAEPLPQVPVFDYDADFAGDAESVLAVETEEEAGGAPPEVAPVEGRVSLLDRNRMARIQAAQPIIPDVPAPPSRDAAPLDIETPLPSVSPFVEPEIAAPAPVVERVPQKRHFRFFDWRVLFGLLDIPAIVALVMIVFGLNPFRPSSVSQSLARACETMDRTAFVVQEAGDGIGGDLGEAVLFSAGTVYHIQDTLVISQNHRLLIEAGAQLVFAKDAALDVRGSLYACGVEGTPVTFTADDKLPGGWVGLRFYDAADDVILNNAEVHFAGERALYLENSAPMLANVTIANSNLFPISVGGNVFPDFSNGVDLRDNPFKAVEIRQGTLYTGNVIWPKGNFVYVISGLVRVGADTTLEIQPGVVVKVWPGEYRTSGLWVRGLLKAEGVQFTSAYDGDEVVGGVTYLESRDPVAGDWDGITFHESSDNCSLRDVTVRYAGQGRGAILMKESSPELVNVTVTDSAWYPLSLDADSFPTLETLTLADNVAGDAVAIRDGSVVTGREARTWEPLGSQTADQIVRVILGTVMLAPEASLTLGPGVVIKFAEEGQLILKGTLNAVGGGSETNRIVLTSLHDDDYGGDTDGPADSRQTRQWGGVVFEQAGDASVMQNAIVRYGTVRVDGGAPRLINNRILDGAGPGIAQMPDAQPELLNNLLEGNSISGVAILSGTMTTDQNWARLGDVDDQVARVLLGEVVVAADTTLRVGAGAVIKAGVAGKLTISGTLQAPGMAHMLIVFTSLQDDAEGGDTDNKVRAPEPGDWLGLEMGAAAKVEVSNLRVLYAETGLAMYGGNVPVVEEGRFQIANGNHALWCDTAVELPGGLLIEENQVNENRCPTR